MELTKIQICEAFSGGDFDNIFYYLSDDIVWTVFQQFQVRGREAVINRCKEIAESFKNVDTKFKQLDVIEGHGKVVITGSAEFSRNGNVLEFVDACDVYAFDRDNRIKRISSYCVVKRL